MEGIVNEALALSQEEKNIRSGITGPRDPADVDAELDEILMGLETNIKVIGCGGGGSNSTQRMLKENIEGADLIALNTDAQHLRKMKNVKKVLIGRKKARGLGAGGIPQIGEDAAFESIDQIKAHVEGADMVFITAGLGGGTGTGSAPVVAEVARDADALTIAVVTLPFAMEGPIRMTNAEAGLERLRNVADTVIVVPNDRLLEVAARLPLEAAFKVSDDVVTKAVQGITELITKPGLVNLDFADVRTVMQNGGVAMIGLGEEEGEGKAVESVHRALRSKLLDIDISGATSALVNVVGGPDMTIEEAESVIQEVYKRVDPNARLIWGAQVDPDLEHRIRTMIVVTGVKSPQIYGHGSSKNITRKYGIDFVK